LRVTVEVKNPPYVGAHPATAYSKIILDRDKTLPYDYEFDSPTQSYAVGQQRTTVILPTIATPGSYYLTPAAYGLGYFSQPYLTDGAGWYDPFFTVVSLPGVTRQIAPINGVTVPQPVTFRWSKVEGATKYWLAYSLDNWATEVGDSLLTDTLKVVSGLPEGATVKWAVSTGNAMGWNLDGWNYSDWFRTAITTPTTGSLRVDVYDIGAVKLGAGATVRLLNNDVLISTQITNDSGSVMFSDVPYGMYSYSVHFPNKAGTPWTSPFYLGTMTNVSIFSATAYHTFIRNAPYVKSIRAHFGAIDITEDTVKVGNPVVVSLEIANPNNLGAAIQSAFGRLVLDRDQMEAYEFDQTSPYLSYAIGQVRTVQFNYVPLALGTYYRSEGVVVDYHGAALADGWGWRPLFTVVSDFTSVDETPATFALFQNYPNPFNPTTTIEYTVEESGPVVLKVVDVLGRETILVNENQTNGGHRFVWTTQTSGTFFAVLETPNKRNVIRMSAIK